MEITSGVTGGIVLVFLIISLVFYRNWKYEQELDSLLWKVDFKDIQINEEPNANSLGTKITRVSLDVVAGTLFHYSISVDSSLDKDEPSVSQLQPRRRLPLFNNFHPDRYLQGSSVRDQEGAQKIHRHHQGNEEGIKNGLSLWKFVALY
jgi:hypothetical protein